MKLLVVNVGTTSLKYRLYDMPGEDSLAHGYFERVGKDDGMVTHSVGSREVLKGERRGLPDFDSAVGLAVELLTDAESGAVSGLDEISAFVFKPVAVRGLDISGPMELDEVVLANMEASNILAPLHNPACVRAVRIFRERYPGIPCIGLFESAFHAGVPEHARVYGIPYEWTERHSLRGCGYHGASHRYIAEKAPEVLDRPADGLRLVNCHLGGSSSVCAIKDGKSIDTSMGLSPQSGLLHASRSGDMDPFVFPVLLLDENKSAAELVDELCTRGGLLGISGISGDMRDLRKAIRQGNSRARLAVDAFVYGIKKYIGAYAAALGGLDALCFTGGIGENDAELRSEVCAGLEFLGVRLDPGRNRSGEEIISTPDSRVAVMALCTNEELILAREACRFLEG